MTDLAVLAVGFGVLPLASVLLYLVRDWILGHRGAVWGALTGVLAFLGLSHAMAHVLEAKPFLLGGADLPSALFLVGGLGLGSLGAWFLFEGPLPRTEPAKAVAAATIFLSLHSFGDGLVLGRDFVGGFAPSVSISSLTVFATIVHRFVEGAILLVPAIAARWKVPSVTLVLLVSILAIPAAYVPGGLADAFGLVAGSGATLALSSFLAAAEAAFALLLLLRGFMPMASADRGMRWFLWTSVGFVGISLVHFLVE